MSRWEGPTGGESRVERAKHGEIVFVAFTEPQDMGPQLLVAMTSWDIAKHGGDFEVKQEGPFLVFTPVSQGAIQLGRAHSIPVTGTRRIVRRYIDPTLEPKPPVGGKK